MASSSRHTVFIEDDGNETKKDFSYISTSLLKPHFAVTNTKKPEPALTNPIRTRLPITNNPSERRVPVISGSPWLHYKKKYVIKHWCPLGIVTARTNGDPFMIRTISGTNVDEQVDNICQLFHANVVRNLELYSSSDGYFLISEFMATSLLQLCRCPQYPSERALGTIWHQILQGAQYLLSENLVLENISCGSVMITFKGEVKISNIEHCKQGGSLNKFSESFSKIVMNLMDKTRDQDGPAGLTYPDRWSEAAIDFFTITTSQPSLEELQAHSFVEKTYQEDLLWIVPFVLVSAKHFIDEFDT